MRAMTMMVSCVVFAACGGQSYCEQQVDLLEECGTGDVGSVEDCEATLGGCSNADQASLRKFTDCALDAGVDFCPTTASTGDTTGATSGLAVLACIGEISDLSESCLGITEL